MITEFLNDLKAILPDSVLDERTNAFFDKWARALGAQADALEWASTPHPSTGTRPNAQAIAERINELIARARVEQNEARGYCKHESTNERK